MANRNKLDRKGRPYKKIDNITFSGMRHWDSYRHLISSGAHGNLKKYYLAGVS